MARLRRSDHRGAADHPRRRPLCRAPGFDLGRIFTLPAGDDEEIDIEGLTHDGGYLWIVGSHSLKRKKPKRHENDEGEALAPTSQEAVLQRIAASLSPQGLRVIGSHEHLPGSMARWRHFRDNRTILEEAGK